MVIVRDGAAGAPVAWSSWEDWRSGRLAPRTVWLRDLPSGEREVSANWCPVCWGNGRLFEMAQNGEGPIPVAACTACDGTGEAE